MNNIFNDNFLDSNDCKVTIGPIITEIRDVSDTEMEHTDLQGVPLRAICLLILVPSFFAAFHFLLKMIVGKYPPEYPMQLFVDWFISYV